MGHKLKERLSALGILTANTEAELQKAYDAFKLGSFGNRGIIDYDGWLEELERILELFETFGFSVDTMRQYFLRCLSTQSDLQELAAVLTVLQQRHIIATIIELNLFETLLNNDVPHLVHNIVIKENGLLNQLAQIDIFYTDEEIRQLLIQELQRQPQGALMEYPFDKYATLQGYLEASNEKPATIRIFQRSDLILKVLAHAVPSSAFYCLEKLYAHQRVDDEDFEFLYKYPYPNELVDAYMRLQEVGLWTEANWQSIIEPHLNAVAMYLDKKDSAYFDRFEHMFNYTNTAANVFVFLEQMKQQAFFTALQSLPGDKLYPVSLMLETCLTQQKTSTPILEKLAEMAHINDKVELQHKVSLMGMLAKNSLLEDSNILQVLDFDETDAAKNVLETMVPITQEDVDCVLSRKDLKRFSVVLNEKLRPLKGYPAEFKGTLLRLFLKWPPQYDLVFGEIEDNNVTVNNVLKSLLALHEANILNEESCQMLLSSSRRSGFRVLANQLTVLSNKGLLTTEILCQFIRNEIKPLDIQTLNNRLRNLTQQEFNWFVQQHEFSTAFDSFQYIQIPGIQSQYGNRTDNENNSKLLLQVMIIQKTFDSEKFNKLSDSFNSAGLSTDEAATYALLGLMSPLDEESWSLLVIEFKNYLNNNPESSSSFINFPGLHQLYQASCLLPQSELRSTLDPFPTLQQKSRECGLDLLYRVISAQGLNNQMIEEFVNQVPENDIEQHFLAALLLQGRIATTAEAVTDENHTATFVYQDNPVEDGAELAEAYAGEHQLIIKALQHYQCCADILKAEGYKEIQHDDPEYLTSARQIKVDLMNYFIWDIKATSQNPMVQSLLKDIPVVPPKRILPGYFASKDNKQSFFKNAVPANANTFYQLVLSQETPLITTENIATQSRGLTKG